MSRVSFFFKTKYFRVKKPLTVQPQQNCNKSQHIGAGNSAGSCQFRREICLASLAKYTKILGIDYRNKNTHNEVNSLAKEVYLIKYLTRYILL